MGGSRRFLLAGGALLTVALHLATSFQYGYQRDELYFIACGRHLAWGYVDQPPLIALIADAALRLFGDSLTALRLFPALAAGRAGRARRRARAALRRRALRLASSRCVTIALAPFDFAVGNLLTMNAFEPLFWTLAALLVFDELNDSLWWRVARAGALFGLGFLNKWSMLTFGLALVAGLALSPSRTLLRRPGALVAVLIAAAIAAPNLLWQAAHGWPQIELLRNAAATKDAEIGPLAFIAQQSLVMGPGAVPVWLAGLWRFGREPQRRAFAWTFAVLLALYIALHAKVYYMAPLYPLLIAGGAAHLELALERWRFARAGLTAFVALASLVILPAATPILPLSQYLVYQRALDVRPVRMEQHDAGQVPQHFADQLGWASLVETLSAAVAELPASERNGAAILTADYGQAAALQFLGRDRGLPPVISGHNQYYLWGPQGDHAVLVTVGIPRATLLAAYGSITQVGIYTDPYVLPYSNNLPVYVCRGPRIALTRFWPALRRYI